MRRQSTHRGAGQRDSPRTNSTLGSCSTSPAQVRHCPGVCQQLKAAYENPTKMVSLRKMDPLTLVNSVNRTQTNVVWKSFCGVGEDVSLQIIAARRRGDRHGKDFEGVLEVSKGDARQAQGMVGGRSTTFRWLAGRRTGEVMAGDSGRNAGAGATLYLYKCLAYKAPHSIESALQEQGAS